jgi:3-methyladenine DNA glycosylase AlkC
MSETLLLKDVLFNKEKVEKIAKEIRQVYPSFRQAKFVADVLTKFPELELKARISWIAECLKTHLPVDYKQAMGILLKALPPPNNPTLSDNDFGDFIYAPYAELVAKQGCTKEHLQFSLNALYEITQRFSVEDAIRYFLNAFPKETLKELQKWSKNKHYHVRRLTSEGTRPKLPWSQKINIPISAPILILDNLFSDQTRFVTRSVANHLNDISKIDPDLTIDTLSRWQKAKKQNSKEMEHIIRHALRTLVKQGNKRAIEMLGYTDAVELKVINFIVPETILMNEALDFSFTVQSVEDANIIIDYIIYFQNKAGQLNSKKVFKLKSASLKKNTPIDISKRHLLKEHMATRTLYRGRHEIEIQINGKSYTKCGFDIT